MKRFPVFIATVMMVSAMQAADKLDLKAITSGEFAASYVTGINPIDGTDLYASISNDGKQVISYSFKTGKQMSILFDVNAAKAPFGQIEGYVISPDGKKLLIMTHREAIYRRSFKAEYFIYDIAKKSLKKLSQGVNQQVATWSPDSRHIAFVKDNNLFVTDGDKETRITRDGKFNEVINGIPDWVYEEEFSFNRAFAWNADGTAIGWIRFDESHVKTYSLQMFEGSHPHTRTRSPHAHEVRRGRRRPCRCLPSPVLPYCSGSGCGDPFFPGIDLRHFHRWPDRCEYLPLRSPWRVKGGHPPLL